jgi:hypothetical protein
MEQPKVINYQFGRLFFMKKIILVSQTWNRTGIGQGTGLFGE